MITHHIETDTEFELAGYFADDVGRRICSWNWNGEYVEVVANSMMRRVSLSEFDLTQYSDEELRDRIVDIAKSTGEDLRGQPFE